MRQEPSSQIPDVLEPAPAVKEELQRGGTVCDQPSDDNDSLDEGILDKGGQLTPIDDLASPEDSYFLEFKCTGDQTEKMLVSPQTTRRVHLCQTSCTQTNNTCPDGAYYTVNGSKTYQSMPKGNSLIELPLTQLHVWVHYKINKLPVPEWGAELSH